MEHFPIFIVALVALLMVVFAVLLRNGKGYWMISGYNTMSKEKKQNVDIENLAQFMGNMLFVFAVLLLLLGVCGYFEIGWAMGVIIFLFIVLTIFMGIKAQAYDRNAVNPDGTWKKKTKVIAIVSISLLLLTAAGIGVLFYFGNQSPSYFLADNTLKISGFYGEEISLKEVKSITLQEQLPDILSKNNGYAFGSIKKGYFSLRDIGKAKLFIDAAKPPFIVIELHTAEPRIINCETPAVTDDLYRQLLAAQNQIKSE